MSKIYNEDCLETFKRIDDKSIDMVLTSPPYDNLRSYHGFSFDFENTARELFRVIKDGGVVVWVVGDATIKGSETGTSFKQALYFKEIGFNLHDTMIYQKSWIPFPMHTRYQQMFEYMFVFSKGKPRAFNPIKIQSNHRIVKNATARQKDGSLKTYKSRTGVGSRSMDNIWKIKRDSIKIHGHPAIFPLQLASDHITSWSNEGDIILDPFMGSGTTAIACLNTNRNYIGCELDKTYYDICIKRIEEHKIWSREIEG